MNDGPRLLGTLLQKLCLALWWLKHQQRVAATQQLAASQDATRASLKAMVGAEGGRRVLVKME